MTLRGVGAEGSEESYMTLMQLCGFDLDASRSQPAIYTLQVICAPWWRSRTQYRTKKKMPLFCGSKARNSMSKPRNLHNHAKGIESKYNSDGRKGVNIILDNATVWQVAKAKTIFNFPSIHEFAGCLTPTQRRKAVGNPSCLVLEACQRMTWRTNMNPPPPPPN